MMVDSTLISESGEGLSPQPIPELDLSTGTQEATPTITRAPAPTATPAPIPVRAPKSLPESKDDRSLAAWGRPVGLLAIILGVSVFIGRLAGTHGQNMLHNKMLPWILGRSLGIATYVALAAMVFLGLWLRHPWRARFRRPGPEAILWAHVTLAACTVALLVGHLTALALDRYAGVGWTGVFVPWGAQFRPTAVALGTLAFYLLLLIVGTAALAGSIGRAVWFPIHTASVVVFCMALAHGVMAGSDSVSLRWMYVASGLVVLVLQFTRWLAGTLRQGSAVVAE